MRRPNLSISLLFGVIAFVIFLVVYVTITYLSVGKSTIIITIWAVLGIGIFIGSQIHILRKLRWLEDQDEDQDCKEDEE